MTAAARAQTRFDERGDLICLLLDIRGQARNQSLQVFSYSKGRVVNLPRFKSGGAPMIRIETPDAKRWAAVSVPRWLAVAEGLYGKPDLPPVLSGFCREHCTDMRTPQMVRDDGERELAEAIIEQENRYRLLPGQRRNLGGGDIDGGRMRRA